MKKRTMYFHRQFTNKRIAVTSLRRLYLKHGIKCKKVRQEKVMPLRARTNFVQNCQLLLNEIEQAKGEGRLLVYLDEINFTKRSLKLREWSGKNTNLTVDQKEVYIGYRSVIASMTEEKGIGLIMIYDQAITAVEFAYYLKKLRAKSGTQPLALFMDRLAVHKSKDIKDLWAKLNIKPVFNVSYSPEYNPIEAVFSKVKRHFNSQRLNNLVNKIGFNADKEIEAAFGLITVDHCAACVRKSLFLLKRES